MRPFVDVFLTVSPGYYERFPATLYSALTQTYSSIRMVLFLEQPTREIEELLNQWWYTDEDDYHRHRVIFHDKTITQETCKKGIIIRNPYPDIFGLQWFLEWQNKSPYVKFLESGDILIPECIDYMINAIKPDVDGVFIPVVKSINGHFSIILERFKETSFKGILFKRETFEKMLSEGFVCQNNVHETFVNHCVNHGYKLETTSAQNFLYMSFEKYDTN